LLEYRQPLIESVFNDKNYKYTVGLFQNFYGADRIRKELVARGLGDAFVVPYINGVRASLSDSKILHLIEDSAEHLEKYLKEHNLKEIDYVISAIPFVSLPDELGYSIVGECRKFLKEGGLFIQIHYSLLAKKIYKKVFGNVKINFEPLNIPPAFVLISSKKSA